MASNIQINTATRLNDLYMVRVGADGGVAATEQYTISDFTETSGVGYGYRYTITLSNTESKVFIVYSSGYSSSKVTINANSNYVFLLNRKPNYVENINRDLLDPSCFQGDTVVLCVDTTMRRWVNNDASEAFMGCTNLVGVRNLDSNITKMDRTFKNCTNFDGSNLNYNGSTGTTSSLPSGVYIYSFNITSAVECFANTHPTNTKMVYIPFTTLDNSTTSSTYDAFTNAGYDTLGTLDNVILANLCRLTLNVTPSNAFVEFNSTGVFSHRSGNYVIIPAGVPITYTVSLSGYETQSDTITLSNNTTINVSLRAYRTLSINPTPSDATVVLTATGYTQVNNSITVPEGTSVTYTVSKQGYITETDTVTVNTDNTIYVVLEEERRRVLNVENFNYTTTGNDNITLTEYIGNDMNIVFPEIEEI